MKVLDFEYNGIRASDHNIMVCTFGTGNVGIENVNYGSQITFNTTPMYNSNLFLLTSSLYSEAASYTFQICKHPDSIDNKEDSFFTTDEQRFIYRWLNRNDGFFPLKIFIPDFGNAIFNGSFNITAVELSGEVIGYELSFQMSTPFALQERRRITYDFKSSSDKFTFMDISDNIGYIYPNLKIICNSSGDLELHNSIENRTTIIKNCSVGEEISIDEYLNISTSLTEHKIQNDFNYIFFRVSNTFDERKNTLSVSIPCKIIIEYNPILKGVGL